jgi:hypothetical protein
VVVAERVDADPGDEVEIARPILGDELRAVPRHEQGTDAGIHVEQGGGCGGGGGHAG